MLCIHAYHSFSPVSLSAHICNAPHNVYTTQHMSSFYHHDKLFAGASLLIETSPLHHKERNTPMSSASNYESSRSQANIAAGDAAGIAAGGLIGAATGHAVGAKLGGIIGTAICPGLGTVVGIIIGVKLARMITDR